MSKLEELINQLCPDGVEYRELWELTIWDKKFNAVERHKQSKIISYPYLLAAELFNLETANGDVFLLSTGERTGWTTEELAEDFLCEGEVVTIPWGKSRPVAEVIKYYKGKFITADNRIATSNDTSVLSNKYLYYWMVSKGKVIDKLYRGSGIKHPSMKDLLDLKIHLPPLPIQEEIARILDNITSLTAELTKKLAEEKAARQKQYEYYRDSLLSFEEGDTQDGVRWMKLGECCKFFNGDRGKNYPSAADYVDNGIPFINAGDLQNGIVDFINCKKISSEKYALLGGAKLKQNDIVYCLRGSIGKNAVYSIDGGTLASSLVAIRPNEMLNSKYLYYLLNSKLELKQRIVKDNGAAQPNLSASSVKEYIFPVPSLEEQQRIVDILDRFDKLCNDISEGLPAEIEARKKQYEYYRDKLLTFKEKEA